METYQAPIGFGDTKRIVEETIKEEKEV